MESNLPHSGKKKILLIGGIVVLAALTYGISFSYGTYKDLRDTEKELADRTAAFESNIQNLERRVMEVEQENQNITATLSDEQIKNLELEREKRRTMREIDELTRLTTLDPELLKKYSKVYFLSENYVPSKLDSVSTRYLIDSTKPVQVLDDIEPYLDDLLNDADDDGQQLRVLSGYRSFETQMNLKTGYRVQYGTGANTFSAEQGYSEHQLGTAVDFTTPTIKGAYTSFETTSEFAWLTKNAYKYGFILSYPKGNQYYVYEPWHWRFVGKNLAEYMRDERLHFYEMDQREIDKYLIDIFD